MTLPQIDYEYLINFLTELLKIPSPTGYTQKAIDFTAQALKESPGSAKLKTWKTRKGALIVKLSGEADRSPRALTAHVDTLGAMVKEIKSNGRLKLTKIGNYPWNTVEGEGCTVFTRNTGQLRGSILLTKSSSHVYGVQVNETRREEDTMEVRLDARASSAKETNSLGIEIGNFVAFDPRVEINNGFIRSRHLDDKAGVACLVAAAQALQQANIKPKQDTFFHFSNYEEVGHGAAAGIPSQVEELVVVDMAAVGEGQSSDEFHAALCVKDSGGPYHHDLSQRLLKLAAAHQIAHNVDIYPYYGSDGTAYWRSGGDVAVALIGPGVDASHNYERTHKEALEATTKWIIAYLLN
ncbi:MAG: M42 family metallopeptidase [Anaerolineales bacterium]|nr:M42 family metallopeptidase [Anaerolineales bacterium]